MSSVSQQTGTTNKGGPFNGFSAVQTHDCYKNSEDALARGILRRVWNYESLNTPNRVTSPFRAANNLGDTLGRVGYTCGGPNQTSSAKPGYKRLIGGIKSQCDDSNVTGKTGNVKFVADSSDYIRFKKQTTTVSNYNDLANGGSTNGAYVALMRVRRS
jgi:hypothetical protein